MSALRLSGEQSAALRAAVDWYGDPARQEFYLAGYAGTGKSTLVPFIVEALKKRHGVATVRSGAYTGKAAHVLRRKGAAGAGTIHSMIYRLVGDAGGRPEFELNPDGPAASADLIVLDECSMIGDAMATDLRSFGRKILVLGDPGQLPPVGGGGAFTRRRPDAFLRHVHRQAAENPILRLAAEARQGRLPRPGDYGDGVRVIPFDEDAAEYVHDERSQVICGLNRVRWALSRRIRARRGFEGPLPRAGERLICCRNRPRFGVFNGQMGVLTAPPRSPRAAPPPHLELQMEMEDSGERRLTVHPHLFAQHFDGAPAERPRIAPEVCEFDWGWVLTCHKAQGSQWPRVTVIDDGAGFREDRWKWLYTAITRAQSELTLLLRG